MSTLPKPLIPQRADPYIHKHTDGYYYFTASVPAYDGIELRRSKTLEGLASAEPKMVWIKPDNGPYSELIWAPEIHFNDGAWYVYFAAAPSREIKHDLFQHRMYAISCKDDNPLEGEWKFCGQIKTPWDTFCLDATTFYHIIACGVFLPGVQANAVGNAFTQVFGDGTMVSTTFGPCDHRYARSGCAYQR